MKQYILILAVCFGLAGAGKAQVEDVLWEEVWENLQEEITEGENSIGGESEGEEYLETLSYFLENPLPLNSATEEDLRTLKFLSVWQIQALLNYRESYGGIVSWNELFEMIPSIDAVSAARLQRFCTLESYGADLTGSAAKKKTKHQLLARYGRALYKQKGYTEKKYAGGADNCYLKYTLNAQNRITAGFAAQQDPGEKFTKQGFDAYSGYITLKNTGFIKNLTAGHYKLDWGYGLNIGAPGGFYASNAVQMQSCGAGIRSYASGAETGYLQGLAGSFRLPDNWLLETFYSYRKIDGTLASHQTQNGYHRTENETAKKNGVAWQLAGIRVEKNFNRLRAGFTGSAYHYKNAKNSNNLSAPRNDTVKHTLGGNLSLYYQYLLNKWHFYGEYAYSTPRGFSLLQGIQWKPADCAALAAVYKFYGKDYYSPYADIPDGKEKHLAQWQVKASVGKYWELDVKGRFLWQRTRPDLPFYGGMLSACITYATRRFIPSFYAGYIKSQTREVCNLRAALKTNLGAGFGTNTRMECNNLNKGILLAQDLFYTAPSGRWQIKLRAALFETDGYTNRFYLYEPDVLYGFSSSALYGKGCRIALLVKAEPVRNLHIELKYAHSLYDGVQSTGSGNSETNSYFKPEIKIQLRYNFRSK